MYSKFAIRYQGCEQFVLCTAGLPSVTKVETSSCYVQTYRQLPRLRPVLVMYRPTVSYQGWDQFLLQQTYRHLPRLRPVLVICTAGLPSVIKVETSSCYVQQVCRQLPRLRPVLVTVDLPSLTKVETSSCYVQQAYRQLPRLRPVLVTADLPSMTKVETSSCYVWQT